MKLKAILIDPIKKSVGFIEIEDTLEAMYKILDCDTVTCIYIDKKNAIWLDDNGRIRKDVKDGFLFEGYRAPLAGYGLVLGFSQASGENEDVSVTIPYIHGRINWISKDTYPPPMTTLIAW